VQAGLDHQAAQRRAAPPPRSPRAAPPPSRERRGWGDVIHGDERTSSGLTRRQTAGSPSAPRARPQ
jgi:hypothetical protein